MQENSDFFAIFSLEDARVASYSLEIRGKEYLPEYPNTFGIMDIEFLVEYLSVSLGCWGVGTRETGHRRA